ncbi:hypothetical protein PR048_027695 [Dryococelus australis]|uniref:Uncharacterized protein n=1 Tax=Dryococelus australis TaxID=614101 RepID=A0ABQ9GH80_9NEOP|nr:hypothetical protein PR048_027695 [Dryococelus australis]
MMNLLSMWTRKRHSKELHFLHIGLYHHENDDDQQKCKDLQLALTYEGHHDVDGTQLHQELIVLHSLCDAAKSLNGLLEVHIKVHLYKQPLLELSKFNCCTSNSTHTSCDCCVWGKELLKIKKLLRTT